MSGELVFVVHPEESAREAIGEALHRARYKVLAFERGREAAERIENLQFLPPDVILLALGPGGPDEAPPLLSRLRASPLTDNLPVVVLASGDPDERRRALRLGLTDQIQPPYDDEEVLLTTRLALQHRRDDRVVTGSLSQLDASDLLQTAETGRRSGRFTFRHAGESITLWMSEGRIIQAESTTGRDGEEAVFAVCAWEDGSFEADFGPVSVPRSIDKSTSALLLEAARRRDETARDQRLHAALADPPPPPPRHQRVIHRALTLLNVASSYATDHAEPTLVTRRLEEERQTLASLRSEVGLFVVHDSGQVSLDEAGERWSRTEPERLVEATALWLRRFFERMERGLPGHFSLDRLARITEAVQDDLDELGFSDALGIPSTQKNREERAS